MDNLTHTLFGITLARTPLDRAGRGTTAALILASNAPDIDIVTAASGAPSYLQWHRGPTHGPLGVIALGVLVAGIVWAGSRLLDRCTRRRAGVRPERDGAWGSAPVMGPRRLESDHARFGALALVSILAVLLHILMDLPTSYGTRVLSPFDWRWFAADLMPIIDIYLLTILTACLWLGREAAVVGEASLKGSPHVPRPLVLRPSPSGSASNARRRNVVIALSLMAVNYGARAVAHREALAIAPRIFGPTLPDRCDAALSQGPLVDRWPIHGELSARDAGRRCLLEIAALPTFASPFQWRLVAQMSNAYETLEIDLIDLARRHRSKAPWRRADRYPNHWTPAAFQAAAARTAQVFLGFSRFPAARSTIDPDGNTTVSWSDVRFALGPPRDRGGEPPGGFFMATVIVDPDGEILQERFGP